MTQNANTSLPSIGVALIGTGFAAKFHIEAYKRVSGINVRLLGAHSRRPESTKKFVDDHGLSRVYGGLEELFRDPEVDLVDTCVPNRLHEEMVVQALEAGKHVAVEKPFTGSFRRGKDPEDWQRCLDEALSSADRMIEAENRSGRHIMYAENWVYTPGIQKAHRLLQAADTSILRMVGEESHSGTHSTYAMQWETSGGGSLLNKGCHPLAGAIYLKYMEGIRRIGRPIRPSWVIAAVANLTESAGFKSRPSTAIRTGWIDCEDWGTMVVGFDDDTLTQISAADIAVGGIQNVMSIYATNASVKININPNDSVLAYAPNGDVFEDEYIREKVETKAGWQYTNPDEDWMNGFPHEIQDFCEAASTDRQPVSGSLLGRDVVAVCYSAYLSSATGKRVNVPTR